MMDKDIKKMVKEIVGESLKEMMEASKAMRKKTDAEIAEIRRETEEIRRETEEIHKETERNIKKIARQLGNYTDNVSEISEEYFYQSLKGTMKLGGIRFDDIGKNRVIHGKEYDVILENGNSVMLVSVKTALQKSHVDKLVEENLPALKKHFRTKKLYGAVAGLSHKRNVREEAVKDGVLMLSLSDKNEVTTINPNVTLRTF